MVWRQQLSWNKSSALHHLPLERDCFQQPTETPAAASKPIPTVQTTVNSAAASPTTTAAEAAAATTKALAQPTAATARAPIPTATTMTV